MKKQTTKNLSLPFVELERRFSNSLKQSKAAKKRPPLNVVGLFAGIGGVERGLAKAGHKCLLLCEIEQGAKEILRTRFPSVPLHDDVTTLNRLPEKVDLIAGGFPCQDLSQAGKAAGILNGKQSSLVGEIFRLIQTHKVPWVLLENVSFMLKLDSGNAMNVLATAVEQLGYKWAYRVVNSLAFGVPQRRERVIFVASQDDDPREVLFADEVEEPIVDPDQIGTAACGFYWTEGIRGLGWAVNAVPTLKGGSTIGIPSPPAIVFPDGSVGTPDIRDAERMQGFPANWTLPARKVVRDSTRWKMVGNAVTVDLFSWIGKRLRMPDAAGATVLGFPMKRTGGWPNAGWNVGHGRYGAAISSYPLEKKRPPLKDWLKYPVKPLSLRAVSGFLDRVERSSLRFPPGFVEALIKHRSQLINRLP